MVICIKFKKCSFLAHFKHFSNCARMKIVMWIEQIGGLVKGFYVVQLLIEQVIAQEPGSLLAVLPWRRITDCGWGRSKAPMVSSFRVSWQSLGGSRGTRCSRRGLPGSEQTRLCINIRKYFIRPQLAAGLGWYQATVNKIINIGIMSLSCVELKT